MTESSWHFVSSVKLEKKLIDYEMQEQQQPAVGGGIEEDKKSWRRLCDMESAHNVPLCCQWIKEWSELMNIGVAEYLSRGVRTKIFEGVKSWEIIFFMVFQYFEI